MLWLLAAAALGLQLPGFSVSPYWDEQLYSGNFSTDVFFQINAPAANVLTTSRPTQLIIYFLPNGNTIAETVGKQNGTGVDWHFLIQQIGAQTRRLRQEDPTHNWITAYMSNIYLSWPTWHASHSNAAALTQEIVAAVLKPVAMLSPQWTLASHSGGGSFMFQYMNGSSSIAGTHRMVFLDSDYDYDDTPAYGLDLVGWLQANPLNHLCVVAYDDRNITFNGKPVTPPDGGTYRHTYHMIDLFMTYPQLELVHTNPAPGAPPIDVWLGLGGRIDIRIHRNPQNIILHTVLVYENGFIHGQTSGTTIDPADVFFGQINFLPWVQPDTPPK